MAVLGILLPLALWLGVRNVHEGERALYDRHNAHGQVIADAAAIACLEPLLVADYPLVQTYVDQLIRQTPHLERVRVVDAKGRVVAVSPRPGLEAEASDSPSTASPHGRTVHRARVVVDDSTRGGRSLGQVELRRSTAQVETDVATSWRRAIRDTILVVLAAGLVLALVLYLSIGAPMHRIDAAAIRLSRGDLETPVLGCGPRELHRLAKTLEHLRIGFLSSQRAIEEKNRNLERLDKVKSDFLATMSHEMRTPLNGVVGFAHELLESGLDAEQADMAHTLVQSADCLLELIGDILDVSKMQAGSLTLESRPFSPVELVSQVCRVGQAMAHGKEIDVLVSTGVDRELFVDGDRKRLRQVLLNLVGNAVKFTDIGSVEISVDARPSDEGDDVELEFLVRDTGIGISDDALPHIFDEFRQQDSSFSRQYGGSGLGLAICRRLTTLMNGTVDVRSEAGVGSEFSVRVALPASAVVDPVTAVEESSRSIEGARVLVADDDAINRKLVLSMLVRLGASVTLTVDGRDCYETFQSAPDDFDVILMDCQMPRWDGLRATREIRAIECGATIPIIACTANAMAEDKARCIEAGMTDYVSKPISPARLKSVLACSLAMRDAAVSIPD